VSPNARELNASFGMKLYSNVASRPGSTVCWYVNAVNCPVTNTATQLIQWKSASAAGNVTFRERKVV